MWGYSDVVYGQTSLRAMRVADHQWEVSLLVDVEPLSPNAADASTTWAYIDQVLFARVNVPSTATVHDETEALELTFVRGVAS